MGFFQGVARAYGEISERKEQEKIRKEESEARKAERVQNLEDQKELASYNSNLAIRGQLLNSQLKGGPRGSGSSSGSATTEKVANAMSSLTTLGVDNEFMKRLEASGNPDAILSTNKIVIEAYTKMRENGVPEVQIPGLLNQELETWDFGDAKTRVIEFEGEEFEVTDPGGVGSVPIVVNPNLDVANVEKVEQRILSNSERQLAMEKKRLQTALTTLGGLEIPEEYSGHVPVMSKAISDRLLELEAAENSYEGGNILDLITLYGKGPVEREVKAFNVPIGQLNSVFTDETIPDTVEPWSYNSEEPQFTKEINLLLRQIGAIR
jgi:hypothetical protein